MLKNNEIKKEAITKLSQEMQEMLTKNENVSLRRMAQELDISYHGLLKASKKPIVGAVYDPNAINYEALALEVLKREVDFNQVDWEEVNATSTHKGSTLVKDIEAFEVGKEVYLRGQEKPYKIVYKTKLQIVLQLQDSEELRCLNHSTFMFQGPKFEPREVAQEDK